MLNESTLHNPVFINTIGHAAGVLLFGFIIALLLRDRHSHGVRKTKLSITAACLAFAWNVGSLVALGTGDPGLISMRFIVTANFAVLSLLPAVLLQLALQGRLRWITVTGYAISAAAVILHVAELFIAGPSPHQAALLLVAVGFMVLTILAAVARRSEWLSLACLLLFASSFPHFGYQHFRSPWAAEIAWHHIGIPVALVVLLQDYRFLLLDTFIRFLMNSCLAAAYVGGILFLNQKVHLLRIISSSVFFTGIALVSLCLSLILFAHIRNQLQRWMGRAIFHRQNLDDRIRALAQLPARTRSEEELIYSAAREVAAHLRAEKFAVVEETSHTVTLPGVLPKKDSAWAEAQVPLRFSSGEIRMLLTGARLGRQRYLSEDLEDMQRLASVIVEQVERFRSEELKRLATQAELRALQAQINPHFLFNAFNTLYGTIDRGSFEARRLVLNLTDIFRYFLQGDRSVIALSEEMRIIKAYLEIEALRLGDRLETRLDIDESALPVMIPILSIQPLVENAVKHGVASKAGPGRVVVSAHVVDGMLRVTVEDSSASLTAGGSVPHAGYGVGIANVRRRLNLSYGAGSTLDASYGSQGSVVTLVIPTVVRAPAVA
jgi:hypothetical protein